MLKESDFQHKLIKELKERFPGCVVVKNDSSYIQGIPDLTIFYKKRVGVIPSLSFFMFKKGDFKMLKESDFQHKLIKELKERFPGCVVVKNDSSYIQGIPDLTIFYKKKWATLECKIAKNAKRQPNQDYYISLMNGMSFSKYIYPENKEDVLNELQQAFES